MFFHFPSRLPSIYEPCSEPTSPSSSIVNHLGLGLQHRRMKRCRQHFRLLNVVPSPTPPASLRYRTCRRVSLIPPESSYIMPISHPRSCLPIPLSREPQGSHQIIKEIGSLSRRPFSFSPSVGLIIRQPANNIPSFGLMNRMGEWRPISVRLQLQIR